MRTTGRHSGRFFAFNSGTTDGSKTGNWTLTRRSAGLSNRHLPGGRAGPKAGAATSRVADSRAGTGFKTPGPKGRTNKGLTKPRPTAWVSGAPIRLRWPGPEGARHPGESRPFRAWHGL